MASAIRQQRQQDVGSWTRDAFGTADWNILIRARKLVEEVAETAQAAGVPLEQVLDRVKHVYSRPVGELDKEIGGVGVTLLALAEVAGINADREEEKDFLHVLEKPLWYWTKRNEQKRRERREAGLDQ